SQTRNYVRHALTRLAGGPNWDNCPKPLGGIREKKQGDGWKNPFKIDGDSLAPFTAASDDANKVVHGNAWTNLAAHAASAGHYGIYFFPSRVAGDDYRLKAAISFTGHPRKAQLDQDNGPIFAETGTFRIIRVERVAAVVGWPPRVNRLVDWNAVKDEFTPA